MRLPAFLLLAALLLRAGAEDSLADKLFHRFLPPNAAARALTPPSIFQAETPIVVRYTLIGGIAIYESQAACHPTALSFFGTKDAIPAQFCSPDTNAVVVAYTIYAALKREFPNELAVYAAFLRGLGLEPESSSTDRSTINGWANFAGTRLADFFATDGWNSMGDITRQANRRPFEDYTNYSPANAPDLPISQLRRPLRWQPLRFPVDRLGRFSSQVHVTPHIGVAVKPLVLGMTDFNSRTASPPYSSPNRPRGFSRPDRVRLSRLTKQVLSVSEKLTPAQRFHARWWNNKLLSTASISAYYEGASALSKFEIAQQFMGEMLAQHDALLVTWREKRRHDLARPRTLIQARLGSKRVRAFVNEREGVKTLRAFDWEPLVPEQPHSEYPSGSAALCAAALEHIEVYNRVVKGTVPTIKFRLPAGSLPFPTNGDVTVTFLGPKEAAESCAQSRLWAGVHFPPAVEAGKQIGKGIGTVAFEHIRDLGAGRIPKNCERCLGNPDGGDNGDSDDDDDDDDGDDGDSDDDNTNGDNEGPRSTDDGSDRGSDSDDD